MPIRSILGSLGDPESEEKGRLEEESYRYAMERVMLFAGQPPEKQIPIAEYSSGFDPERFDPQHSQLHYFDIDTLKPGAILRMQMGGYEGRDVIYSFIIAGKRDAEGRFMLYDVEDLSISGGAITTPSLQLGSYGFRLERLKYKYDEKPYRKGQFPIVFAKDFLNLGGYDWTENWASVFGSHGDYFFPDAYLPFEIDLMMAGEPEKNKSVERAAQSIRSILGVPAPEPIPVPISE